MTRHFIIGGAQRSATTYLVSLLNAHQDICMAQPVRPEPKFFLNPEDYKQDAGWYRQKLFAHCQDKSVQILGEKSTSYYERADVAARADESLPGVKWLFLLRNPVARAISNYRFSKMHGFEDADADTALLREIQAPESLQTAEGADISVSPQSYLARGNYAELLAPFWEQLGPERMLVFLSEDLIKAPESVRPVFHFLGLDDTKWFPPEVNVIARNASERAYGDTPSLKTLARLQAHFKAGNARLADMFGLDIEKWD